MNNTVKNAWITAYLQKKGKNLETLAASLGRATKKVIIERAQEIGIELNMKEKKDEMVRTIINHLETKAETKVETAEYEDPFFKSAAAKAIFYLIYGQGKDRTDALKITEELYEDADKARAWRNALVKLIHPDACNHPLAGDATKEVTRIYKRMIAR